jgi:hypothetical protein
VVNPSVVDGRRGGWGRHCPLFHVLRRFKILCGAGEAGKLMEQGQSCFSSSGTQAIL